MIVMAKERAKTKRPVGRPPSDVETEIIAGRVHPDLAHAVSKMADHFRRSVSAEVGIAAEERLLLHEALLRRLGAWTAELDRIKSERQTESTKATH